MLLLFVFINIQVYNLNHLTNREASPVLCSVVKHAANDWSTKEVSGETRGVVECFSQLLCVFINTQTLGKVFFCQQKSPKCKPNI